MTRRYTVLLGWNPEGPGYAAVAPAPPACFTQGATVTEALEPVQEAITEHIAALRDTGQPAPDEGIFVLMTIIEVDHVPLTAE